MQTYWLHSQLASLKALDYVKEAEQERWGREAVREMKKLGEGRSYLVRFRLSLQRIGLL